MNRLGAAFVDRHLAPVAATVSMAQLDRTVRHALIAFDPAQADRRDAAAADKRRVNIDLGHVFEGTVTLDGVLDAADALDLEHALRAVATQLADLGSDKTLDARRSMALGEIALAQLALDLTDTGEDGTRSEKPTRRGITLNLHLDPTTGAAELDQPGITGTITISQLKTWCAAAGTTMTVRPVIDLNQTKATGAYTPTDAIRQHVELRDGHCVAPYCTKPARSCDLDHVIAFADGGPTSTDNLAPLCRRHHRAKTHGHWTYVMDDPGTYEWTLPAGDQYTVDHQGTHTHPPV